MYKQVRVLYWLLAAFWLICLPTISQAQESNVDTITVDFRDHVEDEQLRRSIEKALLEKPQTLLQGTRYVITSREIYANWTTLSVASLDGSTCSAEYIGSGDNCGDMLLARHDGSWVSTLRGTAEFDQLLSQTPNEFISEYTKSFLFSDSVDSANSNVSDFKFPWKDGETWYVNTGYGWHEINGEGTDIRAIDIAPVKGNDRSVLASADGAITFVCDDGTLTYNLKISHGSTTLEYFHLDRVQGANYSELKNKGVLQGQILGKVRQNEFYYDGCGRADQKEGNSHLHWVIPKDGSFIVEGYKVNIGRYPTWSNGGPGTSALRSTNQPIIGGILQPPQPCLAPILKEPLSQAVLASRTIVFHWDSLNCHHEGYTLRVKTTPNMEAAQSSIIDIGHGNNQYEAQFSSASENRDLYWSVRAANAPGGASWSPPRRFRISTNSAPVIDFQSANNERGNIIITRERNWTFTGTASDSEGRLRRVILNCSGDNCGSGDNQSSDGNWQIRRSGMLGRNTIYFRACDEVQCSDSRRVTLLIDHAAPNSTVSLNSDRTPVSGWYRKPVNVEIRAVDGATGNARADIREIRYWLNGTEHVASESRVSFTVSADGEHTVRYYAVDRAGNHESEKTASFKIDRTPPSTPQRASSQNGAPDDQWQKSHATLHGTWGESTDAHSGVAQYELQWLDNENRTIQQVSRNADDRQFQSGPIRTGSYTLKGRSRDRAGNYSDWVSMFVLRYDSTAPENPEEATHADGVQNNMWQNTTSRANYTWPIPHDEGSGIKGYQVYWGANAEGTSASTQTAESFQGGEPICRVGETCTGYLRIRSIDNVDNAAEDWSTAFTLRYDDTPPTLDFTFPGNITETAQSLVTLQLAGNDTGSGVKAMRFSHDSVTWTSWEAYAETRLWAIPAIGRQSWPIYAQVRDGVGLESPVVRREIYFEVNRRQPRSANYRLFDATMSAGVGKHESGSYRAQSTVGQSINSAPVASTQYQLLGGYQAGSQAIPLVIPDHDAFNYINSAFSSGVAAQPMQSASFRMLASLGEAALPNNVTTLSSSRYQHQPGYLAATPSRSGEVALPPPQSGPAPESEPIPDCQFPSVSINGGATFTSERNVTLSLCAPHAVEVMISYSSSFENANWEPYARVKAWQIRAQGDSVIPQWVYISFKDEDGTVHGVYLDDIIYDPDIPSGELFIGDPVVEIQAQQEVARQVQSADAGNVAQSVHFEEHSYMVTSSATESRLLPVYQQDENRGVELFFYARDANSGITEMQIGNEENLADGRWEPYSAVKIWSPSEGDGEKNVYVRFRDAAGNVSNVVNKAFILDSKPPTGGMRFESDVVSSEALSITLELQAEDNLSGVSAMRLSGDENFDESDWQPFASKLIWPLRLAPEQQDGMLYVQYRDTAGNVSPVFGQYYLVDKMPPVVSVEVQPSESLMRQLKIFAYDELSFIGTMSISNDPEMIDGVVTQRFTENLEWNFDERRVVWIQITDSSGNTSEPYPAYAADVDENSPPPGITPQPEPAGASRVYLPLVENR